MAERRIFLVALFLFALSLSHGGGKMDIKLKSSAFEEGGMIPKKYSCDGPNVSPPLEWESAPSGCKAFALICDDPDAPMGTWVHWVVYNIPARVNRLAEGISASKVLDDGTLQGINDFRKIGYGGPCPPGGTHRYYFTIYALDAPLKLDSGATKSQLSRAMEGHILAQGQLMGKYKR
jgi:Raf kinase inhibitor-like YbhB/YbcL family protein